MHLDVHSSIINNSQDMETTQMVINRQSVSEVVVCIYTIVVAIQSPSRVQLCDPTNCCTLGSFVLHYLPEFGQIHFH